MIATALRSIVLAGFVLSAPAHAAHSDWADADESRLRLLLAAPENTAQDGAIEGGIEIQLEPDWYTYWRNPGEAGVPPIFDFSGSENVANVAVSFPAPERHDDGTSVSLVYHNEVVFPLVVTPREAGRPVTLRLEARFGVCSDVCIPTRASADVALTDAPDPLSAARLQSFAARVPKEPEPNRFDIEAVTPRDDALLIDVRMPESSYLDLFSEAPEGWYLGQPTLVERAGGVSRYRLSLAGRPKDAEIGGKTFRFVAVSGAEAIEEAIAVH